MSAFSNANRSRQFQPPEAGAEYPVYDLTGSHQRLAMLTERLAGQSSVLSRDFGLALRQRLNHNELDVRVPDWQEQSVPVDVGQWLSAFHADRPDQPVILGLDNNALFGLSEIFFGGDPALLKQDQERPVTDTERRLINRIYNSLLALLCPAMELDLDHWQSHWLDHAPPAQQRLWCRLAVSLGDWTCILHCGWPADLIGADATTRSTGDPGQSLRRQLEEVSVRLKVDLASLTLNLEDVAELKQGDILPVNLDAVVTASAGETPCLKGQICEHGDRLALRISEFFGDKS